jgi:hypothetical protein
MPGDKFVPARGHYALVTRCSFCIRTEWIPARSPRPLYGSPAPVKVVRKIVSGAARRWFGLRLHR